MLQQAESAAKAKTTREFPLLAFDLAYTEPENFITQLRQALLTTGFFNLTVSSIAYHSTVRFEPSLIVHVGYR